MQTQVPAHTDLEPIWEAHREKLRRFLLSLTRDFDLAEDLLQETYLHAQAGFPHYRGGDAAAWLLAIAKNTFRGHLRQRGRRAELPLEAAAEEAAPAQEVVELLAVRQAVQELPAPLRTALVMKHYAGFTYDEIAARLHCPTGTAKWRVSEALQRLRAALPPERRAVMAEQCEAYRDRLVDFVYGLLPKEEADRVAAHLAACPTCQAEVADLRRTTRLLDTLEGNWRMTDLVEISHDGAMTHYSEFSFVNMTDGPLDHTWFGAEKESVIGTVLQDGAEVAVAKRPSETSERRFAYDLTLHHPVPPGERVRVMMVTAPTRGNAQRVGDRRWRFWFGEAPGEPDIAYLHILRLPAGATLVSATARVVTHPPGEEGSVTEVPPPQVAQHHAPTLTWREVLSLHAQFECTVEYDLRD